MQMKSGPSSDAISIVLNHEPFVSPHLLSNWQKISWSFLSGAKLAWRIMVLSVSTTMGPGRTVSWSMTRDMNILLTEKSKLAILWEKQEGFPKQRAPIWMLAMEKSPGFSWRGMCGFEEPEIWLKLRTGNERERKKNVYSNSTNREPHASHSISRLQYHMT